jgi:hypothetical protein
VLGFEATVQSTWADGAAFHTDMRDPERASAGACWLRRLKSSIDAEGRIFQPALTGALMAGSRLSVSFLSGGRCGDVPASNKASGRAPLASPSSMSRAVVTERSPVAAALPLVLLGRVEIGPGGVQCGHPVSLLPRPHDRWSGLGGGAGPRAERGPAAASSTTGRRPPCEVTYAQITRCTRRSPRRRPWPRRGHRSRPKPPNQSHR